MSAGVIRKEEPTPKLWWELTDAYWDLPFYADAGMNCEAQLNRDDELSGREQLWAIREQDDEIQPLADEPHENEPNKNTTGGTE